MAEAAKDTQIAPRVHHSRWNAARLQGLDRTINGIALGDTAKINQRDPFLVNPARSGDADVRHAAGKPVDVNEAVARQKSASDQLASNSDVEQAIALMMERNGAGEDLRSFWRYNGNTARAGSSQSAKITGDVVERHESVNISNGREASVEGRGLVGG